LIQNFKRYGRIIKKSEKEKEKKRNEAGGTKPAQASIRPTAQHLGFPKGYRCCFPSFADRVVPPVRIIL
jgi:hypothetical protein